VRGKRERGEKRKEKKKEREIKKEIENWKFSKPKIFEDK
jgi:hypothetical protein